MVRSPACPEDELRWSIAVARLLLPGDVHLQAPPNLSEHLAPLLDAGIDDWGGVSPITADHVNPERAWPALERLEALTEAAGHTLAPRLTIYPEFALDPERWLDPAMHFYVLDASDAEGLARDSAWCSGGEVAPPLILDPARLATPSARSAVGEVLAGVAAGQEVGEDEIVTLFSARGADVRAVATMADQIRAETVGDTVTYVINRNINYTNVCTFKCKFCAFSKGPLSLNLRGRLTCSTSTRSAGGSPRPRTRARPRCACRVGSTRSSTATTTSTSCAWCGPAPSASTSTHSPRSR